MYFVAGTPGPTVLENGQGMRSGPLPDGEGAGARELMFIVCLLLVPAPVRVPVCAD